MNDEELTLDEMQRVLAANQFATIHDLVNSSAFNELTTDARQVDSPGSANAAAPLPDLPARQ